MLLQSYTFDTDVVDVKFYYDIWKEIENLKWYFYKFAGRRADEAMQATFIHAIYHFDRHKGSLNTYIKCLARVITKEAVKEISVDFLEQTLSKESSDKDTANNPKVYTGSIKDFTDDVVEDLDYDKALRHDLVCLALEFMEKYILLCNALIRHDTSTTYYPDSFIKSCMRINNKYEDFNQNCINLYFENEELFDWFINIDNKNQGEEWKETDYLRINSNLSKRVKFINSDTGELVKNADKESFYVSGKYTGKRILKIRYIDVWNLMCDLVDSNETNEIKFVLDNHYIIKTFGGSYSVLDPDLYNIYDLVRTEIVTNLLRDTGGRLINIGDTNIYILCEERCKDRIDNTRVIRGYPIKFDYMDITDSL